MRDQHTRETNTKIGTCCKAKVPDTDEPTDGQTKYSMDYMTMGSVDVEQTPASLITANHEDGGPHPYAATGKGIHGDK